MRAFQRRTFEVIHKKAEFGTKADLPWRSGEEPRSLADLEGLRHRDQPDIAPVAGHYRSSNSSNPGAIAIAAILWQRRRHCVGHYFRRD
jgi:hypothetical protein